MHQKKHVGQCIDVFESIHKKVGCGHKWDNFIAALKKKANPEDES